MRSRKAAEPQNGAARIIDRMRGGRPAGFVISVSFCTN
jgi:hypothetical protein